MNKTYTGPCSGCVTMDCFLIFFFD